MKYQTEINSGKKLIVIFDEYKDGERWKAFMAPTPAANKGLSAMLASEHILIDISLISCSPSCTNITELWNIPSAFYL